MQVQFMVATAISMACIFTSFGIFLERLKNRQEKSKKLLRRFDARLSMPERICGAWVYNDGKGRSHHCILDHDHETGIHRSESGMGRKVQA